VTALELTVRDRYDGTLFRFKPTQFAGNKTKSREPALFYEYLKFMVDRDGLTDAAVPMVRKYGGPVIGLLTGETKPTLADIRNDMAHGYPFDAWPRSGLLELTRDLIEYAYRDFIGAVR
jgi:hypothetical protein